MLPTNLNTNEVKNASGTEVEFNRYTNGPGPLVVYKSTAEGPSTTHRITFSHKEIGDGAVKRRRSVVRVDKVIDIDSDAGNGVQPAKISAYMVVDLPVGLMADFSQATEVVANLISLVASKGTSTTILYDCSGYGADALINGSL
jgi:hypothetical protein